MGFTGQQYVGTGFWKCRLSCCLLWTFIQNWLKQLQCPVACFLSNAENTWALVHGLLIHECQRGRCLHSHMRFHVPIPPPTSRSRFWEAFGKLEEDGGHFGCSPLPIMDESHLCTSPVILTHYAILQSRMASRKTLRIAEIDLAAVAWVKNCYSFLPFTSRPSSKQRRAPRPAGTPILSLQQQPCKAEVWWPFSVCLLIHFYSSFTPNVIFFVLLWLSIVMVNPLECNVEASGKAGYSFNK